MNTGDPPANQKATSDHVPKPWEHAKSGQGSDADPLATQFVESVSYDYRLYQQDIAGSIAHAKMLCHVGLISEGELSEIEIGLAQILKEIELAGPDWPGWKPQLEDVHMCIEAALIEKTGDAGRKLHTGRSRNDQVALDLKLWIHQATGQLNSSLLALNRSFVELASRDGQIVMPSYTHLQRAQPILVGGEFVAWISAFDRARERLHALWEINRSNPLGSGAIAGSGLPLDRCHVAAAVPLGDPTSSSIDATASRDTAIDFVYALAMISMTLSRWAEQWIIYASNEFGFIRLDDRYTTGSSMMPQKSNPDMLELIRGRCGGVYGNLLALLTICKGLGIGYFRDLQEDKRHVFGSFDTVTSCLEIAAKIVVTTRFDEHRIKQKLDHGFLDATSLADYLVTRGVPFRTAHQIVGSLVGKCQTDGLPNLSQLQIEDLNHACAVAMKKSDVCGTDVYDWLGPERVVERYRSDGNAGTQGVRQQLDVWRRRIDAEMVQQ